MRWLLDYHSGFGDGKYYMHLKYTVFFWLNPKRCLSARWDKEKKRKNH